MYLISYQDKAKAQAKLDILLDIMKSRDLDEHEQDDFDKNDAAITDFNERLSNIE